MENRPGKPAVSNGPIRTTTDTLKPLSDDPKDEGLYIVTTYDDFFKPLSSYQENGKKKE